MTLAKAIWTTVAWVALFLAIAIPIAAAAASPLHAWRDPIYIISGFAGIAAMAILLVQPLLAMGYMPGVTVLKARRAHRWLGALIVLAILIHVVGLWITSPPDVVDALLLRSPTSFSIWGVIAMWAVFATALLAVTRKRLRIRPRTWQYAHISLAMLIVLCTIAHAALIEGTMGPVSKFALSVLLLIAATRMVVDFKKMARLGS